MIAFVCTLSLLLCVALAQQCNNDVEVALAGDVRIAGAVFQGGRRWLGVRFGVAPRFQRPRVPPQLPAGTVVNATLQSLACPKFPLFGGPAPFTSVAPEGEDCLFLDIYAPTRDCSAAPQALPVIFWITGGGFVAGSKDLYPSTGLASGAKAVVVTINYRLGALGFVKVPGGDANVGLWDQQLALQWVSKNIAAFGGDPTRVTLAGQSAGGFSVGFHIVSPPSRGLFKQAIIMSGGALETAGSFGHLYTPSEAREIGEEFARDVGCESLELECLRAVPLAKLTANSPKDAFPFPVIDGPGGIVPQPPRERIARGHVDPRLRVLIGHTGDEGSFFAPFLTSTANFVRPYPAPWADALADAYASSVTDAAGDTLIECTSVVTALALSRKVTTFAYRLDYAISFSLLGAGPNTLGALHGEEIPFFFNFPLPIDKEFGVELRRFYYDFINGDDPFVALSSNSTTLPLHVVPQTGPALQSSLARDVQRCGLITAASKAAMHELLAASPSSSSSSSSSSSLTL